jgi:hypothetical protein
MQSIKGEIYSALQGLVHFAAKYAQQRHIFSTQRQQIESNKKFAEMEEELQVYLS